VHPGGAVYGTKEKEAMSLSNKVIRSKGLGAINDNNARSEIVQEKSLLYEVKSNKNASFRPKRYFRKLYLCICLSKIVKQKASSSSVAGVKKSKKKQKLQKFHKNLVFSYWLHYNKFYFYYFVLHRFHGTLTSSI